MRWSLSVGRLAGIPVRLHVTFVLFVALIGAAQWMAGGVAAMAGGLALVAGLFGSVLLHEIGHALAARRYGIPTRDIVLLPFGGVARLERLPERPREEIAVALAGPAVNVAIAGLLFGWLAVTGHLMPLSSMGVAAGPIVERLMIANLGLVLFNLLPAFPLDGGRMLRAALATRIPYARATRVAARVGKGAALVLGIYSLLASHPMLAIVALFIWGAAGHEAAAAEHRAAELAARGPVPVPLAAHPASPLHTWHVPRRGTVTATAIVWRAGLRPASTAPHGAAGRQVVLARVAARVLRSPAALLLAVVVAGAAAPVPAWAQYFGQNKVRAKAIDFKVLETAHFDIHYYEEKREAAVEAGRMAERWHTRLAAVFGAPLSSRQAVILYASHPDFRGTTVIPDEIGETTGGLTEAGRRRIVMPLAGPLAETDHVLGHELVHAFQFDLVKRLEKQGTSASAAFALPLWFVEGLAEYLSIGPVDAHTAMWIRDAVSGNRLPEVAALDDPRYFPYRWGHAFWAYVAAKHGEGAIKPLVEAAMATGDVSASLAAVLKVGSDELSRSWRQHLQERFAPAAAGPRAVSARARPVLREGGSEGRLNVGPAVSPDGRYVAFFSERDGTAVDLFLAATADGTIIRKLTELAVDPHVDSLRFVNGAGAWSPDSRKLAFAAVAAGRAQLTIVDVETGRTERSIPLAGLSEVLTAAWSPDGRSIALSAMANGYIDLFVLRLAEGSLARLTADAYAELHPAWAPNGRSIVYVTDRFTTDLATLSFGELRLARLDLAGGEPSLVRAFDAGKHLNPQWSADGLSLTFIADHDGIANVYRLELEGGRLEQVTRVPSGVSGLSATSPAMSLAGARGTLVFSVFEDGGYRLHLAEPPAGETRVDAEPVAPSAGAIRPASIDRALGRTFPAPSLPDPSGFRIRDYRARLAPEAVAPLQAGLGIGELGPFVTGGTAVTFSDLVGHHNLTVGFKVGTEGGVRRLFDNLSLLGAYQNQGNPWTWGVSGGQTSSTTRGAAVGFGLFEGEPATLNQEVTSWEISRELTGILSRAFSRARRVELAAGYQNLSFRAESRTSAVSAITGVDLGEERADIPMGRSLNMASGHAALVHDTTVFSGTGPAMGERYRLQVGGVAGSVSYVTLLADYRRYVRLGGPFSLAGRVMHFGRYGPGAEDPRLQELFIGYPHLVRGYDAEATVAGACDAAAGAGCGSSPQLFGSRLSVGNLELRAAISGYRGLLPSFRVPIEAALFVDAGVPWSSARLQTALGRSTRLVSSLGVSFRFNLFGSAVGQVSFVRANDRPGDKWRWQFSLTPGF